MKFYSVSNPKPFKGEKYTLKSRVNTTGYESLEQLIKRTRRGEIIRRNDVYHDDVLLPTEHKDFDIADTQTIVQDINVSVAKMNDLNNNDSAQNLKTETLETKVEDSTVTLT
nr:MAG: hypothetical protein [Microvirus sp.]